MTITIKKEGDVYIYSESWREYVKFTDKNKFLAYIRGRCKHYSTHEIKITPETAFPSDVLSKIHEIENNHNNEVDLNKEISPDR